MKAKLTSTPQNRQLYAAITAIKSSEEAEKFFLDLCTPTEIQALQDRWIAVEYLKKGYSYREIYELTGVSVTTVGRVARCILLGSDGYNLIYNRIHRQNDESKKSTQNRSAKKRSAK